MSDVITFLPNQCFFRHFVFFFQVMVCFDWPLRCLQNSYMLFSPSLKMLNRTYHVVCFAFSDFANLCKNDMLKNNELVSGLINTPLSHHSSLSIQDKESKTLPRLSLYKQTGSASSSYLISNFRVAIRKQSGCLNRGIHL